MKIIYVHHGERVKGEDDITELGTQDACLVAKILDKNHIKESVKAIYTASHFRCKKTAEIINQTFNVSFFEDDRLNEFGDNPNETWLSAQARITNCIDNIIEKFDENDAVVCVTSGVNVAAFISRAYGLAPSETTPYFGIPSCSPIIFDYQK